MTLALTRETHLSLLDDLVGEPLSVVFAETDAIAAIRAGTLTELVLEPPFHVSDLDAYLVLPADVGIEIIDILADGDEDLLRETLRDGAVVSGCVETTKRGQMTLLVDEAQAADVFMKTRATYARRHVIERGVDPLAAINALPELRCTLASQFVDEEGLESILREPIFIGTSWRVPQGAPPELHGEPTFAWSTALSPERFGIELALYQEYEELVAVLKPIELVLG